MLNRIFVLILVGTILPILVAAILITADGESQPDSVVVAASDSPNPLEACTVWHSGHSHTGHVVNNECRINVDHSGTIDHTSTVPGDFTVDPAELLPASRGAVPAALPSFDMLTGARVPNQLPPATPAFLEWSDWCFFGEAGSAPGSTLFACSQQIAHFAWALTPADEGGIAADEECVLQQERLYLQLVSQTGTVPSEALTAHGWHHCRSLTPRAAPRGPFSPFADSSPTACRDTITQQ